MFLLNELLHPSHLKSRLSHLIFEVSRSHTIRRTSGRTPLDDRSTRRNQHSETNIRALREIQTRDPSNRLPKSALAKLLYRLCGAYVVHPRRMMNIIEYLTYLEANFIGSSFS